MGFKSSVALCVAGSLGVCLLMTGCLLIHFSSEIVDNKVKDGVTLSPGSAGFDNWKTPKTPVYFQVWTFDVENYEDVLNGSKPSLVQKGPYTYREKLEKFNITFQDNGTVRYRESKTYTFVREMSVGSENDTFHCINIPMITIMNLVKDEFTLIKDIVDKVFDISGEKLFTTLSVGDILWGYPDPFFSALQKFAGVLPFPLPPAKFGLFATSNGTDDGEYEIYTGVDDVSKVGEIVTWKGESKLPFWTSNISNSINGSDGTLYAPFFEEKQTKYLFSSDLCRSLGLDYTKNVSHRGITMERYVAPQFLFANATVNPANAGFCTPKGDCLPSGLLNASVCRQGAPIVLSMPNFLGCDPDMIDSVTGLTPNQLEHQSFLDIEPMTGVVMSVAKRLQINAFVQPIHGFVQTEKLKDMYLPILWFNESALIGVHDADKFKSDVYGNIKMLSKLRYSLIGVGGYIMLTVIVVLMVLGLRKNNYKRLGKNINDDDAPIIT